jgi:tyrosyl-tRNA synthetase
MRRQLCSPPVHSRVPRRAALGLAAPALNAASTKQKPECRARCRPSASSVPPLVLRPTPTRGPLVPATSLPREHGVRVQIGGSDQWGNITAGTDLVRRLLGGGAISSVSSYDSTLSSGEPGGSGGDDGGASSSGAEAPTCYGLTFPLLVGGASDALPFSYGGRDSWRRVRPGSTPPTHVAHPPYMPARLKLPPSCPRAQVDSEGRKFGKSVGGAIWLSADKLSPYKFYQYLFGVTDADVIKLLRMLTFLPLEEIAALEAAMKQVGLVAPRGWRRGRRGA